jgi:thiamine-phosphate pyrophosphorylase
MLRYAITDRTRLAGDEPQRQAELLRQAARWTVARVDFVQLREKELPSGALADLARRILAILRTRKPAPKLLINSRADVAVAAGADGVHLTAQPGELTPAHVRQLYAAARLPEPVVSVSCHFLDEVANARHSGANLILFGPVFEKVAFEGSLGSQRIAEGIGLNLLRVVSAAAAPTPVLALGGVTDSNADACLAAGAAGIAAIRLFQEESPA